MKRLEIQGDSGRSDIFIGERLGNVKAYLPVENPVIITDANVGQLYDKDFPRGHVIRIGTGEAVKNLDTVQQIFKEMVALKVDRSTFILGIGGGVVCDIAGFAASTYMRGVRFGFVSTSLLSQVDASVGGKNGVNFNGYKNMVGVFNQPEFVICDLELLKTLERDEIRCGFSEIVKHAAIADLTMFEYLEENYSKALSLDLTVIEKLVYDSVSIKSTVVSKDEKEKGERRKLNFGHTFGHAIEKVTGVPHGQAVSLGMVIASALSVKKGLLPVEQHQKLVRLLNKLELPTRLEVDKERVFDALSRDKKIVGNTIKFVLLDGIGNAVVEDIPIQELRQVIMDS